MTFKENYLETSCLGLLRGTLVQLLIHPLQTVKTRMQASSLDHSSMNIIYKIFQQKGVVGFYSGLLPKLIDTNIKQFWCWPLIYASPKFLQQHKLGPLMSEALTGAFIGTLDACLSTHLEGAKIRSMLSEQKLPFFALFKNQWHGFRTNWSRLTVQWTAFLTAQSYFRSQYNEKLTFSQMVLTGTKTALVVSIAAAPFDTANTLIQATKSFLKPSFQQMYRGWSYSAFALVIHNVASIILLEHLEKKNNR